MITQKELKNRNGNLFKLIDPGEIKKAILNQRKKYYLLLKAKEQTKARIIQVKKSQSYYLNNKLEGLQREIKRTDLNINSLKITL